MYINREKCIPGKDTDSAKALRQEFAWCIQEKRRQPVWLQQSEPEERVDEGRQVIRVKAIGH